MNTTFRKTHSPKFTVAFLRSLYFLTTRIFGTGFGFASKLLMPFIGDRDMAMSYEDGSSFSYKINDSYWNRLTFNGYVYEQELEYFLHKIRTLDCVFLDCGANYGYWSVLVSSTLLENKEVIAIEASPTTFKFLTKNWNSNGQRFQILNNALYSENGKKFQIDSSDDHAAASIEKTSIGIGSTVESITLDQIYTIYVKNKTIPVIVKLDVEGQEINALKGGSNLLENDVLIIYEDHAQDKKHAVTSFVLTELQMKVYYIDESNSIVEVNDTEILNSIKVNRSKGYNFFGCKKDSRFLTYFSENKTA